MAEVMAPFNSSRRSSSCERWLSRIHSLHDGPIDLTACRRAQQWELCLRKCKAVKGLAIRTRGLVAEGLRQMGDSSDHDAVRERWSSAQNASRERVEKRFASWEAAADRSSTARGSRDPAPGSSSRASSPDSDCSSKESAAVLRGCSSSDESANEEAARLVGAADARAMVQLGAEYSDSDCEESGGYADHGPTTVGSLIVQLKIQPTDSVECAAKFALYEAYHKEVETMRHTLIQLREESRPLLPQSVAVHMDQQVREIDSREAMSIPEHSVEWFVFHMMRTAERNNLNMAGKLDAFERKFKFLAEGDQQLCPICFDEYNDVLRPAETLSCCHKICKGCWSHWSSVMHVARKHAFCPCCNRPEFIGAIKAQVSGHASLSDSDGDIFGRACSFMTRGRQPIRDSGVPRQAQTGQNYFLDRSSSPCGTPGKGVESGSLIHRVESCTIGCKRYDALTEPLKDVCKGFRKKGGKHKL